MTLGKVPESQRLGQSAGTTPRGSRVLGQAAGCWAPVHRVSFTMHGPGDNDRSHHCAVRAGTNSTFPKKDKLVFSHLYFL